jgi:hypothetical protein
MWRDGKLFATCKDGHACLDAYVDDYALADDFPGSLQQHSSSDHTTAYLYCGFQYLAPITEIDELITRLNDITRMT